ncbi:DUF1285 domain-containing protein [Sphingomonas arenae]|uniref:DUF1285 domain-containing protein n=1 Tax=Sphingomonas arenae TaxID=2812555 RepID=UPI001967A37C|nr:DUF1285 domain-containing protein [Sphingomonas arenae]
MPESQPPLPTASMSLAEIAQALAERRLPPVEQWNPTHCGHSGMRIARDGSWFHEGEPIRRPAMVRLFSTVLRREPDGSHVLVTPAEKLSIDVDLAPFVATALKSEGDGRERRIAFELNTGDAVIIGPSHPLRVVKDSAGPIPLVAVRGGLEASLTRSVYYELAELALADGSEPPGIWSDGAFFMLTA